ncbi:major facilitator superfamily multidrug-resistance, DHA1 sub-family [Mycena rosella]|uniref:Major facilitator superfamily multidrug-resistance, DHA1 sub-family n=1 Tax=Mycena rosella TaxID=1033263 RepID=A0AAD7GEG0_MYCRO|nr:major facilitator superfamily multidrug-resistance, DHA1 sub-family [Mycena rosella]
MPTSDIPDDEPGELASMHRTPLPKIQLFIVLCIQLAEPITALVIFPFVLQFVRDTGITGGDEARYVGLIESVFFLGEAVTVFQVGRLSDIYGRRPFLLVGLLGLALSMMGFGLSNTVWALLGFRCAQGAFNGTTGAATTVIMEISDASNLATMMSMSGTVWSVGSSMGSFIGGTLANPAAKWPDNTTSLTLDFLRAHPYFLPCGVAAGFALASFFFALVGLRETSPSAVARLQQKQRSPATETDPLLGGQNLCSESFDANTVPTVRELITRPVCLVLGNYGLFTFLDMANTSLQTLVYATPIGMGGLGLESFDIGLILGLTITINCFIQFFFGGAIIRYFGPRAIFTATFCLEATTPLACALTTFFAKRAGRIDGAVIAVLVCQLSPSFLIASAHASTYVLTMDAAPNPASRGGVNGLLRLVGTTLRCAAPLFASTLFALSNTNNLAGGYMVYIIQGVLALAAIWCSMLLLRNLP